MYNTPHSGLIPNPFTPGPDARRSPAVQSMTALSKAYVKTCNGLNKSLGLLYWELLTLNVDAGMEQLKLLTGPTRYGELPAAEAELMRKYHDKAGDIGRKWFKVVEQACQAVPAATTAESTNTPADASAPLPTSKPAIKTTGKPARAPAKKTRKKTAKSAANKTTKKTARTATAKPPKRKAANKPA